MLVSARSSHHCNFSNHLCILLLTSPVAAEWNIGTDGHTSSGPSMAKVNPGIMHVSCACVVVAARSRSTWSTPGEDHPNPSFSCVLFCCFTHASSQLLKNSLSHYTTSFSLRHTWHGPSKT
ncbi:hypothetical protein BS78_09G057900 [Paspalum vaginatum]|nr:hypothetical protein BS78_09G057900 [Paspalum vaginatum]